jgi:PhnB protein
MQVTPYLYFEGRSEEALEFYRTALGAEIGMVMKFKDMPPGQPAMGPLPPPDKIMHASFKIGDTTLFASDGRNAGNPEFKGVGLSLNPKTTAEATRLFEALAKGGQVQMPLAKTFFAASFGMVADKFGIPWMVIVEPERAP